MMEKLKGSITYYFSNDKGRTFIFGLKYITETIQGFYIKDLSILKLKNLNYTSHLH